MIFPQAGDMVARHPSQLYHVGLEGLTLFRPSGSTQPGKASGRGFRRVLIGYRAFRFFT